MALVQGWPHESLQERLVRAIGPQATDYEPGDAGCHRPRRTRAHRRRPGGGVIKQRLARPGQGKSGGFRTIVLYRTSERAFFVYGFAKSDRADIDADEEAMFKKAATHVLGLSDAQLAELIAKGQFLEVKRNGEEISE